MFIFTIALAAAAAPSIDFTPLIPLINDAIQYVLVPAASLAIMALSGILGQYLYRHGVLKNQQQAQIVASQISGLADKLVTYNAEKLEAIVPKQLIVAAPNAAIATLANYAIAQTPDLLKKGGMDPSTKEGQDALVRLLTARLQAPPPPAPDVTVGIVGGAAPAAPSGSA